MTNSGKAVGPCLVAFGFLWAMGQTAYLSYQSQHFFFNSLGISVLALLIMLVGKLATAGAAAPDEEANWAWNSAALDTVALVLVLMEQPTVNAFVSGWAIIPFLLSLFCYLRYLEIPATRLPTGFLRYLPRLLSKLAKGLIVLSVVGATMLGPAMGPVNLLGLSIWLGLFTFLTASLAGVRIPSDRLQKLPFVSQLQMGAQEIEGYHREVLAQIEAVKTTDKRYEAIQRTGRNIGLGTLLLFILGLLLGVAGLVAESLLGTILSLCLPIGLLGLLVWMVGRSGNVEDTWHEGLMRLHTYLSTDCSENARYKYRLNTGGLTRAVHFEKGERFGSWWRRPRGITDFFCTPIIEGEVTLRDGTALKLQLNKCARRRTTYKKNRRGTKNKTKIKTKYVEEYRVWMKTPKELPAPQDGAVDVDTKRRPDFDRGSVKCKAKGRKLQTYACYKSMDPAISVDGLLGLVAMTFHQLRRSE